jgi:hypothetical protein
LHDERGRGDLLDLEGGDLGELIEVVAVAGAAPAVR